MEGAVELKFSDDDGDIKASREEQKIFLINEKFDPTKVDEFLDLWFS